MRTLEFNFDIQDEWMAEGYLSFANFGVKYVQSYLQVFIHPLDRTKMLNNKCASAFEAEHVLEEQVPQKL